jgi:hypothetical protein
MTQVFVCLPLDGAVHGIHLRTRRSGSETRVVQITAAGEWKKVSKGLGGRCPVVAILPKSRYLVRALELPQVADEEVAQMLRLEVGAHLPSEFGAIEMAYRPLGRRKEGNLRYESYVARREELKEYLDQLIAVGIYPDWVLPSCVAWTQLFDLAQDADLLVASMGTGQWEAASRSEHGAIDIRTIGVGNGSGQAEIIQRSLIECVRSLLAQSDRENEAVSIGWLGADCPSHLANGRILFRDVSEVLPGIDGLERFPFGCTCCAEPSPRPSPGVPGEGERGAQPRGRTQGSPLQEPSPGVPGEGERSTGYTESKNTMKRPADAVDLTLRCFAEGLLAGGEDSTLPLSNLLPSEVVARKQQRAVRRLTLMGGVLILLACVLTSVALQIASHRYRTRISGLSAQIALIGREGESVGRRIEQLQAIQTARATRDDFTRIIAGLCESAPAGLSYGSVEMDDEGQIRLQGQAESLAMAFLLPEQLEKQAGFIDVQPGDAARSRKGEGTIAEFRINCRVSGRVGSQGRSGSSLRAEPGVKEGKGAKGIPSRKEGR